MPFKVDRPPQGIFQWLKLFGGRGPNELEDRVRATVDVRDNYSAALLVGSSGTPTVGALAGLTDTTALGITTRVRAVWGQLAVGAAAVTAGGVIEVGIVMNITGTAVTVPLGTFNYGVALAGAVIGFGVPVDIVLPPCTGYARLNGTAAGADHTASSGFLLENWTGII